MPDGVLAKKNRKGGMEVNSEKSRKIFVCVLCMYFFFLAGLIPWLPGQVVQAAETGSLSIGDMISRGGVKFEVREGVWKAVDHLHFPVFKGMKVKTEKGVAALILGNNTQVEIGEQSALLIEDRDRVTLLQGRVDFRIPSDIEARLNVGTLSVAKAKRVQASRGSVVPARTEETIGSITLHGNGAATVKSFQGDVTIVRQGQALAALSSKDMMTIPSVKVSPDQKTNVAQAGAVDLCPAGTVTPQPVTPDPKVEKEPAGAATQDLGLLLWIPAGGLAAGGGVAIIKKDDDHKPIPRCL
jgi:hypothetical protein